MCYVIELSFLFGLKKKKRWLGIYNLVAVFLCYCVCLFDLMKHLFLFKLPKLVMLNGWESSTLSLCSGRLWMCCSFWLCLNCVVLWLEGSIGEDPNESAWIWLDHSEGVSSYELCRQWRCWSFMFPLTNERIVCVCLIALILFFFFVQFVRFYLDFTIKSFSCIPRWDSLLEWCSGDINRMRWFVFSLVQIHFEIQIW